MPKERQHVWFKYSWDAHAHDGVALIRKFLVQHNFWPRDNTVVALLVPLALVGTQQEQNLRLQQQIIPPVKQHGFIPIRGVQFLMDDDLCQTDYKWKCLTWPPHTNWHTCFRPLASSVQSPGDSHVAWHQHGTGDFVWAMYPSEHEGNLEVKWTKGQFPPSKIEWAR